MLHDVVLFMQSYYRRMSKDHRRAPGEGGNLIVRLDPMPPHDEDVVIGLIGKEQISSFCVFYR